MIAMQDLLDMVATEAFEGQGVGDCQDYGHVYCEPIYYGIEWAEGFSPSSLKQRARDQRELDYASNTRRRKRWAELGKRSIARTAGGTP